MWNSLARKAWFCVLSCFSSFTFSSLLHKQKGRRGGARDGTGRGLGARTRSLEAGRHRGAPITSVPLLPSACPLLPFPQPHHLRNAAAAFKPTGKSQGTRPPPLLLQPTHPPQELGDRLHRGLEAAQLGHHVPAPLAQRLGHLAGGRGRAGQGGVSEAVQVRVCTRMGCSVACLACSRSTARLPVQHGTQRRLQPCNTALQAAGRPPPGSTHTVAAPPHLIGAVELLVDVHRIVNHVGLLNQLRGGKQPEWRVGI